MAETNVNTPATRLSLEPGMHTICFAEFTIGPEDRRDENQTSAESQFYHRHFPVLDDASCDNRIAYSVDHPQDFREIYRSQLPTWVNHWRYNWDQDVVLPEPADRIYVKYTANTGLNAIRACLHLLPNRMPRNHIKTIHTYRVGDQIKSTEKWLTEPTAYTIECSAEPENVSVRLEVPHAER